MSNTIAVLMGPSSGTIVEKIKNSNDNYRFNIFENLSEAIESSVANDILFKRILLYENCLTDSTGLVKDESDSRVMALQALDRYIDDGRGETEVILVCNTQEPTNIHKYFIDIMDNPNVTPVLPTKVTVPLISEFVSGTITELREKFYELDKKGVQTKISQQESESEPKEKKKQPAKKKSGLFGMFGKKSESQSSATKEERSAKSDFSDTSRAQESAKRMAEEQGYDAGSYDQAMSQEYDGYEGSDEFDGPAGDMGLDPDGEGIDDGWDDDDGSPAGLEAVNELMSFGDDGNDHAQTGFLDAEEDEDDWGDDQSSWEDGQSTGFVDVDEDQDEGTGVWEGSDSFQNSGDIPEYDDVPEYDVPAYYDESPNVGYYDDPAPTQAIPRVEIEEQWHEEDTPEYDVPVESRKPEVLDRIVVCTGDSGAGATTEAATIAYTAAQEMSGKVLLIDLDFEKAGVVGMLDNMVDFMKGDHGVSSGNPYKEGPLDILSNGYDAKSNPEDISWVVDSRNYAEYSKIVIDCPIQNLNLIEDLLNHAGIVVMMIGTPVGIVNTVRKLNDWFLIPDSLAKIIDKRGHFYPNRESDDFDEVVKNLKSSFVFDRVNWLSKVS